MRVLAVRGHVSCANDQRRCAHHEPASLGGAVEIIFTPSYFRDRPDDRSSLTSALWPRLMRGRALLYAWWGSHGRHNPPCQELCRTGDGRDHPGVNTTVGVPRLLSLAGLWVLCSAGAVALFIGIETGANRLVLVAKAEEIGVWALYVGVAFRAFAEAMLSPLTASRIRGVPEWVDFVLSLTIMLIWGAAAAAAIRWATRRADRRTANLSRADERTP